MDNIEYEEPEKVIAILKGENYVDFEQVQTENRA